MVGKVWSRVGDGRLLGLGFIVWHLLLIQRVTGNADQWVLSAMFWGAIAYQVMHLPQRYRVYTSGIRLHASACSSPANKLRANRISPLKRTGKPHGRTSTHFNGFESTSPQFIRGRVLARPHLCIHSSPQREKVGRWSRFLGWFLVGGLAIASFQWPINSAFVRVFPGIVAIAWVLITLGWPTRHLWRPALLVLALMMPPRLLPMLVQPWMDDICTLTAQVAAFGLHLVGFSVVQQGPFIQTPQGIVEVRGGCTGIALAGMLLQLIVGMVALFPGIPVRILLIESGAIAFLLSSLRVALMAAVVGQTNMFDYWHSNSGNQVFTLLAFLLFGLLILYHEPSRRIL